MALAATATKVFSRTGLTADSSCYGVIAQADGSYLAGSSQPATSFPFPTDCQWYASLNNGLNWTARGNSDGMFSQTQNFPANVHENIALAATEQPATGGIAIERSSNGANTWSTRFSAAPAASPHGRFVSCGGCQSYEKTKAVAWGALDGDQRNPPALFATSNDAGLNWSLQPPFDVGNAFDAANAFGLAEGGFWWLQYYKETGGDIKSFLARSENYGSTWTVLGEMLSTDSSSWVQAFAIAALDQQNIVIASSNSVSPVSSVPGVWWSDDAGDTRHAVPAADILDWPSGGFFTWAREVKRLTRDSVLLAFDQQNGTPGSPWRISLDKGQTFPIKVNLSSGSFPSYVIPFGKICVARDGSILAMTWESDDYSDVTHCIYRITITC